MAPCTFDFSHPFSKLCGEIVRNSDWLIALFAPVVIGWSNTLVLVFLQSFENCSRLLSSGYKFNES